MNREELLKLSLPELIKTAFDFSHVKSYSKEYANLIINVMNVYYRKWKKYIYIEKAFKQSIMNNIILKKDILNNLSYNINKIKYYPNSIRFYNINIILNLLRLNKTGYICTVFSIKKKYNKIKTNYIYLYSTLEGEELVHNYFCFGINLISSDGEYRSRFVNFEVLDRTRKYRTELWKDVKNHLSAKSNLYFEIKQYSPNEYPKNVLTRIKSKIINDGCILDFYILSWITQGLIKYLNVQNSHIDPNYNSNIFDKGDMKMMDDLIKKYNISTLRTFYTMSSSFYNIEDDNKKFKSFCGQKIIPISIESANNLFNIKYDPWLEYYINEKINKLIFNYITPGVPVTYDWFFIYGVNSFLFDNKKMINKIEISDNAKEIVSHLEKARKNIYYNMDIRSEIKKHLKSEGTYEEKELMLSELGIVVLSEYVGRTINDITSSIKSSQYKKDIGSIFSVNEKFFKYMFDIVYTLCCLNKRLNVIHGDLHLNNTTLRHIDIPYLSSNDWKDKHSAYIIDKECYLFSYNNLVGTIIDFSRGFIIPDESSLTKITREKNVQRILAYYENLFPIFMNTYRSKMKAALITDFSLIYKVFTAIDLYIHCGRLQVFVKKNSLLGATKEVIKLINKILDMAKSYLEKTMIQVITGKIQYIEYPNITILKKCFKGQIATKKKIKNAQIIDVFYIDNALKYSLSKFEQFNPIFQKIGLKKESTILFPEHPQFKLLKYYKVFKQLKQYYEDKDKQINKLLLNNVIV